MEDSGSYSGLLSACVVMYINHHVTYYRFEQTILTAKPRKNVQVAFNRNKLALHQSRVIIKCCADCILQPAVVSNLFTKSAIICWQ